MFCVYISQNWYLTFLGQGLAFLGEDRLAILLCSLARFDLANRGVRQPVQPHTYARLLVFDETLAQPHFAVVNCSDAVRSVFYSPFSTHSQNFAVMNSCVAALSLISSDILTWSADSLYSVQWHKIRGVRLRVEEYAYYVNKLRQNVGLDTWIWRQIVTSQRPHTANKWPPYAREWNPPHEKFMRTPLRYRLQVFPEIFGS